MTSVNGTTMPRSKGGRHRSRTLFVVVRGNMDNAADARKWNDMLVIASFVERVVGHCVIRTGEHSMWLSVPDVGDGEDPVLIESDVVRYVDIQKVQCPADVGAVVDRLEARLKASGIPKGAVGPGLIRLYAQRMYMHCDEWGWTE